MSSTNTNGEQGEDRIMYDDGVGDEEDEEEEEEDLEEEESDDDDEEDDEEEEEEEEDEEDLNSDAAATVTIAAAAGSSDAAAAAATAATTAISPANTVLNGPSGGGGGGGGGAASVPAFSDVTPDPKLLKIEEPSPSERKPPLPLDDSRRLFQRLWTDEDEIGLLQGFLEYTTQRGFKNSVYHHDTAPFYDQIKTRLQLDFNKNQLVEKLRRLKKKYRNVMARFTSGKDFNFKSPHDQATFEISRKIWSEVTPGPGDAAGMEDEEGNPLNAEINDAAAASATINNNGIHVSNSEKKVAQRSRKRAKKRVEEEPVAPNPIPNPNPNPNPSNLLNYPVNTSIPNVVEDTVRTCLSPLFKELLQSAINGGPCNVRALGGLWALNPLPLNFGGTSSLNLLNGEKVDDKWRKQQILELEVYSKRLELVQDQINSALEELRSSGGR
ncbi:hypothetical protein Sjap_007130 [Stephania japonica]|uniref:Glabrous enhancer-binding protein-like DBD domain-containing protein n=1 Tax=Stephania japonica TaxID=461633 RepID=A0AAP0JM04_9MAGN